MAGDCDCHRRLARCPGEYRQHFQHSSRFSTAIRATLCCRRMKQRVVAEGILLRLLLVKNPLHSLLRLRWLLLRTLPRSCTMMQERGSVSYFTPHVIPLKLVRWVTRRESTFPVPVRFPR